MVNKNNRFINNMDEMEIKTPCFVLDGDELRRSVEGFQIALSSKFKKSIVGYSVKTNSVPYCMNNAKQLGCYAEVVSNDEYDLALQCGFDKNKIVYNGPMKSKDTFLDAIQNGAFVNIETHRELEWLKELPDKRTFEIGIRLNVNISRVSPEDADGENDNSRFGFSDETDEFEKALDVIGKLSNVKLSGLHIHRTSHSRSVNFYRNSIKYACETIKKYRLQLDYLDVGGGYFGIFPNKPTYQNYADAFKEVLSSYDMDNLCVIVEPGNALVASCFSFVSEVIEVKHVEANRWFITTDGSRNDIDPFFRKSSYLSEIISDDTGEIVEEQVISGCTCLEYDRLFTLSNQPLLKIGDRILYRNVGAYTMCLSPLFIRYFPLIYLKDKNGYRVIREKWTANEYIQKSIIEE